jgi:hypothetical protein
MTEHNLTFDIDMSEYRIPIQDRKFPFKSQEQSMKNKRTGTKKYFQEWPQVLGEEKKLFKHKSNIVCITILGISWS